MDFNEDQIQRYCRHIILQNVGIEGQKKIMKGKVLVIGIGGLGSPVALYLAASGVGTIGLVDDDVVDLTNLQRQIIHFTADVDKPKVVSAKEKMNAINSNVKVVLHKERLFANNIQSIIKDYDFIVDGTDNFAAKFLINDACVFEKKPFSHGGILRFKGQTMTYVPGSTCYRCIFQTAPPKEAVPSCSQAGVLGSVTGILGTIQATEALKYLIEEGTLLTNRLMIFDALNMHFRTVNIKRNPDCSICGNNPTVTTLIDEEQPVCSLKPRDNG